MAKFTPFPVPVQPDDTPLVTHEGDHYRCTGCGEPAPSGVWISETVEDGMVVGMSMRIGGDGEVVHSCGKAVASSQPNT